ncbi:MAG: hypothetical protein QF893_19235 [Alphaproteobacteria bacterium]|jgi:hypothetical protein|nr:hypothetical protein [Alphaproteobacteria bacterium]
MLKGTVAVLAWAAVLAMAGFGAARAEGTCPDPAGARKSAAWRAFETVIKKHYLEPRGITMLKLSTVERLLVIGHALGRQARHVGDSARNRAAFDCLNVGIDQALAAGTFHRSPLGVDDGRKFRKVQEAAMGMHDARVAKVTGVGADTPVPSVFDMASDLARGGACAAPIAAARGVLEAARRTSVSGAAEGSAARTSLAARLGRFSARVAVRARAHAEIWRKACAAAPVAEYAGLKALGDAAFNERDGLGAVADRARAAANAVCGSSAGGQQPVALHELPEIDRVQQTVTRLGQALTRLRRYMATERQALVLPPDAADLEADRDSLADEIRALETEAPATAGSDRQAAQRGLGEVDRAIGELAAAPDCEGAAAQDLLRELRVERARLALLAAAPESDASDAPRLPKTALRRLKTMRGSSDILARFRAGEWPRVMFDCGKVVRTLDDGAAPDQGEMRLVELLQSERFIRQYVAAAAPVLEQRTRALQCVAEAARGEGERPEGGTGSGSGAGDGPLGLARSALDACKFNESAELIKRLTPGPERSLLEQRWTRTYTTEGKARDLVVAAKTLEDRNELAGAIAKLEEALGLGPCPQSIAAINAAITGLTGKLAQAARSAADVAEAALEACKFNESAKLIKALETGAERSALESRWVRMYETERDARIRPIGPRDPGRSAMRRARCLATRPRPSVCWCASSGRSQMSGQAARDGKSMASAREGTSVSSRQPGL